jgi:hypothetical protein
MNDSDMPRWFGLLFAVTLAAASLAMFSVSLWTVTRVVSWLAP